MPASRSSKWLILLGLGLLIALGALVAPAAYARWQAAPAVQVSPLHPTFALLDYDGLNVLDSGGPLSTLQTCGQCHDTAFITSHSFHSDLGMSEQMPAGQTSSGRPWDTSPGLYGKWDPLSYRYLSPSGDSRPDLNTEQWTAYFAERVVGGGPAESSGVEMNCFICHFERPNNSARVEAIKNGEGAWAGAAALVGTGIVSQDEASYNWNRTAFTADGELDRPYVLIQDPTNANCAQCHGLVHTDKEQILSLTGCNQEYPQTATTGQVISGQRINLSGVNLSGKDTLNRAWDVHAERGLQCVDCHYSLNNPSLYQINAESSPEHLQFDPRRLDLGEYLVKPDHNFARGQSAQYSLSPELKGTMRRCESCHDANTHANWLPYVERHMAEVACETCHIPQMYAPAIEMVDWTVLTSTGDPVEQCRGVDGNTGTLIDLVSGFKPVLLQRMYIDGNTSLAPYNLVSAWFWVYDDPNGVRPVRQEDLRAAWFEGSSYAPEVLAAFDENTDGSLSDLELALDQPDKTALIAARLAGIGLQNPRIQAEVQPYSINHDVARGEWAVRDCASCHSQDSRLAESIKLADYLPGGILPSFVKDTNTDAAGALVQVDHALYYQPDLTKDEIYVFGHTRVIWVDWFGAVFFLGVLAGVSGHGGLRFYSSIRRMKSIPHASSKRVYMYSTYERFWHWLQTLTIILLLVTGLIIHRPDMFGWLSFRYIVTVHNILAAILVLNAALSLFYHLASGEIRQFIPRPYGFFDQAIVQAKFYLQGIFKGDAHPFEKTPNRKMNPLQQATYFGILNVLLPLQVITGALMWGVQKLPQIADLLGGLPFLAPFHSLVAWSFGAFIVAHVYLTTTGHEPLAGIKAMMYGWEDVETVDSHVAIEEPGHAAQDSQGQPAAAD